MDMSSYEPLDRSDELEPLGVIGAGYVGLVTAACLAELGHRVTVREIDSQKLRALQSGVAPIYEPELASLMAANSDRLTFTDSMAELSARSSLILIAVDTPPTYSGDADLSRVMTVVADLAEIGPAGDQLLIMKSTVPVGTGQRIRSEMDRRGLAAVGYVSNPEFLREGSAITDFMAPDRIIIGAFRDTDSARVERLYTPLHATALQTDVPTAEMIKYASNAFLATKISFINEIANVSEEVGADVDLVARGMGLDKRIGPAFLRAGIGYGGSCFPKDVAALKQLAGNSGYHFQLLTSVIEVNDLQKRRVLGKLKKHLGALDGRVVALLGLSFKPGTDDTREAPSLILASRLITEGATVRGYDPVVGPNAAASLYRGVDICANAESAVAGADAVVLVTEWPELVGLAWSDIASSLRRALIVDARNALDPGEMRAAGFTYEGIGRPEATRATKSG